MIRYYNILIITNLGLVISDSVFKPDRLVWFNSLGVFNYEFVSLLFVIKPGVFNNQFASLLFVSKPGVFNNEFVSLLFLSKPGVFNNEFQVYYLSASRGYLNL